MRILLSLALVAALPAAAAAQGTDHVPGELIVKFRASVPASQRADALQGAGATVRHTLAVPRAVLARVPLHDDLRRAAAALERDPRVAWAEPNAYQRGAAMPNDALFGQQWALNTATGPGIDAPDAWDHTTGSESVRVAIVDSGINFDEPDLAPNISADAGWDFVQDDDDPSDNVGHGTHVAGIVAARGNNGIGVAGVAWRASLIPVRVLDNMNIGTCTEIAAGMEYAVQAGARIVNLSLGSYAPCQLERDVIDAAPDVLFVIAAMNDGEDVDASPTYPCAFPSPNIICVAATNSADELAGFSNYAAHNVDLAAPGDNILSSFMTWGPKDSLFTDGFETALTGRWVTGGSQNTWGRSFVYWRSGAWSLSDSPSGQYANTTDSWAQLTPGLDLSGKRDCAASVWVRSALADNDLLISEASPDGISWGRRRSAIGGTSSGFERWLIDLSELEGRANGGLRFRLLTNGSGTNEGVALDDVEIFCAPPITGYTGAPGEFDYDWGTSMAAPHVTGVAALLLSLEPRLTADLLKQVILATVDPLPGLAGKTATGGRLNAASAVGLVVQALEAVNATPPAAAATPSPADPPDHATAAERDLSVSLAADLKSVARSLAAGRIRALLRRGTMTLRLHHQLPPGRFKLTVTGPGRRTIAKGNSLTARLSPRGRALLRGARRIRLHLTLTFTPRSGSPTVAREAVTVRR
jgi:thermitase